MSEGGGVVRIAMSGGGIVETGSDVECDGIRGDRAVQPAVSGRRRIGGTRDGDRSDGGHQRAEVSDCQSDRCTRERGRPVRQRGLLRRFLCGFLH